MRGWGNIPLPAQPNLQDIQVYGSYQPGAQHTHESKTRSKVLRRSTLYNYINMRIIRISLRYYAFLYCFQSPAYILPLYHNIESSARVQHGESAFEAPLSYLGRMRVSDLIAAPDIPICKRMGPTISIFGVGYGCDVGCLASAINGTS